MKIYVAAASAETDRAVSAMAVLRGAGHTITSDWTKDVVRLGANVGLTQAQRMRAASECVSGILSADAIVLLWPKVPSRGAWIEAGITLGLGRGFAEPPVYTLGADPEDTVFYEMMTKHFADLRQLVAWLAKGATNVG